MIEARLVLLAALAAAPPEPGNGPLAEILERIDRALTQASASRLPTPPEPVPVEWGARRLASLELGSPLLALEAADLDGDGKDELLALTTTELAAVGASGELAVLSSAPLPAAPAVIRSRDPVGALSVTRDEGGLAILVRSSEQARGARYRWREGALAADGDIAEFPLCAGLSADLTTGRNHYDPATAKWSEPEKAERPAVEIEAPFYAAECRRHRGPDGYPVHTVAVAGAGREIAIGCHHQGAACAAGVLAVPAVGAAGYAFEVADVDRDGALEVIASRGQPPGERDRIRVFSSAGGEKKLVLSHWFEGGVVAIAAPDLDGDGALEAVAAVRLPGTARVNLWTLCESR